jgi:hypothetical protein
MNQLCGEKFRWFLRWIDFMNPAMNWHCNESILRWIDPSINRSTINRLTMNWLWNKSTCDITNLRYNDPAINHTKLTMWWITMNWPCDEPTMRWIVFAMNRPAINWPAMTLRLIDSVIDQPAMKRTVINRSCDESTLRWIDSVVKSFFGSCVEPTLWTLRYIEIAMNWPYNESTLKWVNPAMNQSTMNRPC